MDMSRDLILVRLLADCTRLSAPTCSDADQDSQLSRALEQRGLFGWSIWLRCGARGGLTAMNEALGKSEMLQEFGQLSASSTIAGLLQLPALGYAILPQ